MTHQSYSRKVCTLANQLRTLTGCTKSQAFLQAHAYVKEHGDDLAYLQAYKVNGTLTSRVVHTTWSNFHSVKGTGRTIGPDRRLFVDAAKRVAGLPDTLSFYKDKIVTLAA